MEMPTNPSKNKDTMKKKNKDGKGPEENSMLFTLTYQTQ